MSPDVKRHLISFAETFIFTFIATVGMFLDQIVASPSKSLIVTALLAGTTAGGKAVYKVFKEWMQSVQKQIDEETPTP